MERVCTSNLIELNWPNLPQAHPLVNLFLLTVKGLIGSPRKNSQGALCLAMSRGMDSGDWAIRLTALLALAGYCFALAGCCAKGSYTSASDSGWWRLGLVALIAHLVCVFHFAHDWSHANALADTTLRTAQIIGVESGFGLYLNYAFYLAWAGDVAWQRLAKQSHTNRSSWVTAALHIFMAFMWFNGTVVFGSTWGRIAGLASIAGLGAWFVLQRWRAY